MYMYIYNMVSALVKLKQIQKSKKYRIGLTQVICSGKKYTLKSVET